MNIKISLSTFTPDISDVVGHASVYSKYRLILIMYYEIYLNPKMDLDNILLLSGLAHAKVRSTDVQVEKEDLGKRASARKGLSNVTVGLGSSFKMFI